MKPAPFDYFLPSSVNEALTLLARANGDATVIAGGQTLVPLMALRMATPSILIDLNGLGELRRIERISGGIRIGATVRQAEILRDPLLAARLPGLVAAIQLVGHQQTRNRGTVGGSIALADPAAEIPATALALGAAIAVRSASGSRVIPVDEFFLGPYTTSLNPDEIVTGIEFSDSQPWTRLIVRKIAPRAGDFAMVGLVFAISLDSGRIERARIAWFGMGPTPMRSRKAEQSLTRQVAQSVDVIAIAGVAIDETDPSDDGHASAIYRSAVGRRLLEQVLREALGIGEKN